MAFIVLGALLSACGSKEAAPSPAPKAELAAFERTPLFKQALDYNAIPRIEGCVDEVLRNVKYHNCRDSKAIYTRALSTAKAMDKPLMVIFGFNKCPYCLKLESEIMDPRSRCAVMTPRNIFQRLNTPNIKLRVRLLKSPLSVFMPAQITASSSRMSSV